MFERFKELSLPIRLLLGLGLIILVVSLIFLLLYLRYWKAVQDASVPEEDEISQNLRAISEADDSLVWKDEPADRRLLVVTWASGTEFDEKDEGRSLRTDDDRHIWVTVVPELKIVCRRVQPECRDSTLRLEQLLGLPPQSHKTQFVEFWVSPSDLFRPCHDPEISDTVCDLDFPPDISETYIEWFNKQKSGSYGWGGYPWTQLGYTYDWGNPQSEIGLSEFVVKPRATIEVGSVTPTNEYLRSRHTYIAFSSSAGAAEKL